MKPILAFFFCYQITFISYSQNTREIDVGGYIIEVKMKSGGSVPVIFEAGLGTDLTTWDPVFNVIGTFTTAIAYSRAGFGNSEVGQFPRTPAIIFKEFIALIDSLNINRPMILVGHSWGGLLVRYYTSLIPERIGGIVLIDGSHEDQVVRFNEIDSMSLEMITEESRHFIDSVKAAHSNSESYISEFEAAAEIFQKTEEFEIRSLPDIPIVVLTSLGNDFSTEEQKYVWRKMHSEWIMNSSNSMWITTERSGHFIHQDQPNLVIEAIEFINNILLSDQMDGK